MMKVYLPEWSKPHACNMPSAHSMKLCSRIVKDGERYCWQHRNTRRAAIFYPPWERGATT